MDDHESDIAELQSRLSYLERHIEAQDAEFYRLTQQLKSLTDRVSAQAEHIRALSQRGNGNEMPADEKPPHY
ncbi:MAG: SlyX family protein [Verrucomicrobiota bacterium]